MSSGCPLGKCDGSGWLTWRDGGGLVTATCPCRQREAERLYVERLMSSAGIPARFGGRALVDLDDRHAEAKQHLGDYVLRWPESAKRGVALVGGIGVGKTAHAYAFVHDLCQHGVHAVAANVPELLDDLARDDNRGSERMDALADAELVLLDDFGAHRATEWTIGRIYALINRRYGAQRPTCVTSMVSLPTLSSSARDPRLAEVWGAVVDRLIETCDIVLMRGKSRRSESLIG